MGCWAAITPRRLWRRLCWAWARAPERADARRVTIADEMRIARQSEREGCGPSFRMGEVERARSSGLAFARWVNDDEAGAQRNMNDARAVLRRGRECRDLGEEKFTHETLKHAELTHDT